MEPSHEQGAVAPQGAGTAPSPPARPLRALAAVTAGAVGVGAAVGLSGSFPLSDDWSYAFAARALCETGDVRLLPWTGAGLVLQAWYGAGLCSLFGFSFPLLRASTVVLAAAGAFAFHQLLAAAGVRGSTLTVATLLLALNPLYVSLAFTFMTDVPCTAFSIIAAACYVRGLVDRRLGLLLAGSGAAAAALLVRQHGILVAAAAAGTILLASEWSWSERLRAAAAVAVVPVLAFVGFHVWLVAVHGLSLGLENKLREATQLRLTSVVNCGFRGLEYLGLFLCPLAVGLTGALWTRHRGLVTAWWLLLAMLASALFLREGALMFYLTNTLYDFGLGPLTLRDTLFLGLPAPIHVGRVLGVPLTLVATASAGVLAAAWSVAAFRERRPASRFLLLAFALLFSATLLHTRYYFDRYLVLVVPFAIAATLVLYPQGLVRPATVVLTALLGWYAVAGTHDYLAWNRARFDGIASLEKAGMPATAIDGGFEYNGWHLSPRLGRWPTDADVRPGQPESRKSWWWVVDDRFVVSFRPLPGYDVREVIAYRRWLTPGDGRVFVLERHAPKTA